MEIKKTKREIKKEETLKKLLDAMIFIMDQYDFETLTIRNICTASGVSSGSFYNLFENKEKFLTYYLTHDFMAYKENYYKDNASFKQLSYIDQSIDIFVCCADYNKEKGIKFISGFYSPYNYDLCPLDTGDNYFCFTPLVEQGKECLTKAIEEGTLKTDLSVTKITEEYVNIFNGCTFNWCISKGKTDISNDLKLRLNRFILSINTSK